MIDCKRNKKRKPPVGHAHLYRTNFRASSRINLFYDIQILGSQIYTLNQSSDVPSLLIMSFHFFFNLLEFKLIFPYKGFGIKLSKAHL